VAHVKKEGLSMHLRLATLADAAAVHGIYAPIVRETIISFELEPPTIDELGRRITYTLQHWPWLVAEEAGAVVGYGYASRHRDRAAYAWSVDLAVYVHPRAQRRGVGRRLYQALFPILERQGLHAAFAGITLPNEASVGLHESLGFTPVGVYREVGFKLRAWRDVGWWQRPLAGPTRAPAAFIPLPALGGPLVFPP
jgi:phosphinothricin acetyltransferase